jgi:hypothetical protein
LAAALRLSASPALYFHRCQDLVQAFFAHLLAQNTLSRADQAKGRLRTFLLGSLQNFLINEHDRARALKRGGKYEILSFDQHLPEAEAAMSGTAHLNDVSCYDLTWASNVVKRSWQDLHEVFAAEGKSKLLEELKPFCRRWNDNPTQSRGCRGSTRRADCDSPHMAFSTAATILGSGRRMPAVPGEFGLFAR